jgi:hypothetical protein
MKLLNCALVALALSGTGCGSQSSLSPQVLQVSGTVRLRDGTAMSRAKVSASTGDSTLSSTLSDPAGRFIIVVPANGGSITLRASEADSPGDLSAGTRSGFVRVGGSPGRITIDIVLDHFDPI